MRTFLLIGFVLCTACANVKAVSLEVAPGVKIRMPDNTLVLDGDKSNALVDGSNFKGLSKDGKSLKLVAGVVVGLEIAVVADTKYTERVNKATPLKWLTFQTMMLQAQVQDVRRRSNRSAAMSTGDRRSDGSRVVISRSSWFEGDEFRNVLLIDVFHSTGVISFHFTWTGPEGSKNETLVDEIAATLL
jgi:hypothetical protein